MSYAFASKGNLNTTPKTTISEIEAKTTVASVTAKHPGRPTKISVELIDDIAMLIRAGASVQNAVCTCGIGRQTFYDWLDEEKYPDEIYQAFRDAIEQARAEAASEAEIQVKKDKPELWLSRGPGSHKSARETVWATQDRIELSGPKGGPIQMQAQPLISADQLATLSTEELKLLDRLINGNTPTDPSNP